MTVITLIGDLVGSRRAAQRPALQRRLHQLLERLSAAHPGGLASPYTLTLGDEFQAVYRRAEGIVPDLLALLGELRPVRVRFALGVGPLSTAINPTQALGMDGPAFHRARAAMETLKATGALWRIGAEPEAPWAPLNHVLAYVGHHMNTWDRNRFAILRRRLAGVPVAAMVEELGISKVAIHKNIRVAGLDDVAAICHDVTAALARALRPA